jgi:phosphocarrier protein
MELTASDRFDPLLPIKDKTMSVIEKIPLLHRLGLHLRAGAELTRLANQFKSRIYVSNGYREVNVKSLLDLLTLGAIYGTLLEFSAEGEDATQAIRAIRELIYTWREKDNFK